VGFIFVCVVGFVGGWLWFFFFFLFVFCPWLAKNGLSKPNVQQKDILVKPMKGGERKHSQEKKVYRLRKKTAVRAGSRIGHIGTTNLDKGLPHNDGHRQQKNVFNGGVVHGIPIGERAVKKTQIECQNQEKGKPQRT